MLTRREQLIKEARNLYLNRNIWLMYPNHEYPIMDNMTWFEKAQRSTCSVYIQNHRDVDRRHESVKY